MNSFLPVIENAQGISIDFNYSTKLPYWNKFASVRSRPRRIIEKDEQNPYLYPLERKPICSHPLVRDLGEEKIGYILTQSVYKFMSDIAFVEVEVINNIAHKIYNGTLGYIFPTSLRTDLLSIIIDETYHAYVAIDCIEQLQKFTGITPLEMSNKIELNQSIDKFIKYFDGEVRDVFEIIAVCIGENTLTKELFNMTKSSNVNKFFHQIMADHMIDEGRHSEIFSIILTHLWRIIPEKTKLEIAPILPLFILDYLKPDLHIEFDRTLLKNLDFNNVQLDQIINDTYSEYNPKTLKLKNPIYDNIIKVLKRAYIFDDEVIKKHFVELDLL